AGVRIQERSAPMAPNQHAGNEGSAYEHRHITAFQEFEQIRQKKRDVETEEKNKERAGLESAPAPGMPRDNVEQNRSNRHRSRDRDAIRRRQSHRLAKDKNKSD